MVFQDLQRDLKVYTIPLELDTAQHQFQLDLVNSIEKAFFFPFLIHIFPSLFQIGMAVGRDLKKRKNHVIAVIGDGAMTAGMAYEAMNNAGYLDTNMIVILNDNKQVLIQCSSQPKI